MLINNTNYQIKNTNNYKIKLINCFINIIFKICLKVRILVMILINCKKLKMLIVNLKVNKFFNLNNYLINNKMILTLLNR